MGPKTEAKTHVSQQRETATSARPTRVPAQAPHPLLQLQGAIGNQAVQNLLRPGVLQTRLAVGRQGDAQEQEADRVSEMIVETNSAPALQRKCGCSTTQGAACAECSQTQQPLVQRRSLQQDGPTRVPPIVNHVLGARGQPLDPATRAFMEERFNHDFGDVRVHADAQAAESARAINALAYTVGSETVFGAGQYAPATREGRKLLAHELTHVVQQRGGGGGGGRSDAHQHGDEKKARRQIQRQTPPGSTGNAAPPSTPAKDATPPVFDPLKMPAGMVDPNKLPTTGETVTLLGLLFSESPIQLEAQLRMEAKQHGLKAPENLVEQLKNLCAGAETAGATSYQSDCKILEEKILPLMEPLVKKIKDENEKFLTKFDAQARANTKVMLENNKKQTEKEAARYGLQSKKVNEAGIAAPGGMGFIAPVPASLQFSHTVQEDSPSVQGLKAAAKVLLDRKKEIADLKSERASHVHVNWWFGPLVFFLSDTITTTIDPEAYKVNEKIEEKQKKYEELRRFAVSKYPVLGGISNLEDFNAQLESVANDSPQKGAQVIGNEILDRRDKISQVQADLKTLNLWKLPKVVGITRAEMGIEEGSLEATLVDEKVRENEPSALEGVLLLAANILAIILAPVTEGLSLVAMAGVNAAMAGVHIAEYIEQEALSGTAFDKANALSADEPSLFWLALEIAGVFVDVAAAAGPMVKAFNNLKGLTKAAIAAREGKEATEALEAAKLAAKSEGGTELAQKVAKGIEDARAGKTASAAATVASPEEVIKLGEAAARAAEEGAAKAFGEAGLAAGGKVKVTKAGHLWSCASPCTWLREKYAGILKHEKAVAQNLEARLQQLEDAAKLATTEEEANKVAREAAELESKLRMIPDEGWESPLAKDAKYQDMLKRRGTASNVLDRKPPDWTGREEAAFRGLPEAETNYHWRLDSDGNLGYVRESVDVPPKNWNPLLNEGKGGFEELTELKVERAQLVGGKEEAKTLALTEAEQKSTKELLDKRNDFIKTRDRLEKLEETQALTPAEAQELKDARYGINEQSRALGEQSADKFIKTEYPGAKPVYGGAGSRPGDFDLVYKVTGPDGKEIFLVVEAKGGSSTLGTRLVEGGTMRAEQGTSKYFDSIADNMRKQGQAVGADLQVAKAEGRVKYLKVQAPINDAPGASIKVGEFVMPAPP
jgi:hypothetical protein